MMSSRLFQSARMLTFNAARMLTFNAPALRTRPLMALELHRPYP
jgi:hypothetical protein